MADSLQILAVLNGDSFNQPAQQITGLTQLFQLNRTITLSTSDVAISLDGIAAPKVLIVKGDVGITLKINAETNPHSAYPFFVESDLAGKTITTLTVSNSDTKDHLITIMAAA